MSKKRSSRSDVILDEIDTLFLHLLAERKAFLTPNQVIDSLNTTPSDVKSSLNITHKALMIHIRRLQEHHFIEVLRTPENKKFKLYALTVKGRQIIEALKNSPQVQELFKNKKFT